MHMTDALGPTEAKRMFNAVLGDCISIEEAEYLQKDDR